MIKKTNVFADELALIQNPVIKAFTEKCLENTPDYFFKVAASSTGKYHPEYALGEGGLIRHTKALIYFAKELLVLEQYRNKFSSDEKDIIISAGILHDSFKHGKEYSKYTITEHPLVAAQFVKDMATTDEMPFAEKIAEAIAAHMGEWNTDYKSREEVLPKPVTEIQQFVHMCDYLASRKNVIVNFEKRYELCEYEYDDCSDIVKEIIEMCKKLVADGYSRDTLIQIIAQNNHGNGNPLTIRTKEVADNTKKLIEEVYYGRSKEEVSV